MNYRKLQAKISPYFHPPMKEKIEFLRFHEILHQSFVQTLIHSLTLEGEVPLAWLAGLKLDKF